jgi:hypothetical protein
MVGEDVQHSAILIDCAPEIVLHTLDPNEYLVHVLLVSWQWEAGRRRSVKLAPDFLHQRRTVS